MGPMGWSVILLAMAVLFILLEVVIPSGGLLSVLAGVLVVASIITGFTQGLAAGGVMLAAATIVVPVVIFTAIHFWPHTPLGRLIYLRRPKGDAVLPRAEEGRKLKSLIGKYGLAKTKMLPGGAVVLEGSTYDAMSEGAAIEPGQPVRVTGLDMNHLVVRLVEGLDPREFDPATSGSAPDDDEAALSQPIDTIGLDTFDDPLG